MALKAGRKGLKDTLVDAFGNLKSAAYMSIIQPLLDLKVDSSRFAVLNGTLAVNGSNVQLNYPSGFTVDNTIVLAAQAFTGSSPNFTGRTFGLVSTSVEYTCELTTNKIQVTTRDAYAAGSKFVLLLYKV